MRSPGFAMILALVFMLVLAVMAMAMVYFISTETKGIGFQLDDTKALYLAQAGVERALREIRDDVLTTTQTGTADLRGADATGSVSVDNVARILYIAEPNGLARINANTDEAFLRTFDSNYTQTRIVSVSIFARASRAGGGTGATLEVSYTTNNGATFTTAIAAMLTTTLANYSADVTSALASWQMIMDTANFRLRARRTAGNRNINLDALWLRVTYEIDTNTEPWFTGVYDTFPKTLGDGTIESVSIADEAGKVHLNTASQSLLSYLMQERGVAADTADTLAANILTYRGTNRFDSVEELQQVSGMTTTVYNLIKDFVTVHSFITTNTFRPSGARAPININTAPREVLEAIFDALNLDATDVARLATDIINTRTTTPFTCFYHSDMEVGTPVLTDFFDFVRNRPYLSTAGDPDEEDRVLDNADASSLVPVFNSAPSDAVTTEFCYATTAFKVESVGKVGDINLRVKTILGDDGGRTFSNFFGDTTLTGYWKENYE